MIQAQAIHKTYLCRVICPERGHARINQVFGLLARLYNTGLESRIDYYKKAIRYFPRNAETKKRERLDLFRSRVLDGYDKLSLSYFDQTKEVKTIKGNFPEYEAIDSHVLHATLKRLDKAFQAFFKQPETGFPKFQSSRKWNTLELAPNKKTAQAKLRRKKEGSWTFKTKGLPVLILRPDRELPPKEFVCSFSLSRNAKRLQLAITYKLPATAEQTKEPKNPIGIDVGVSHFLTLSNGETIDVPVENDKRKKRLQRSNSRKKKGSKRREEARKSLAKESQRLKEIKKFQLHEIARKIIDTYDFIVVEDLKIKNMTASAKGTMENPGKNVRQKAGLNRSILEQSWGIFFTLLEQKAKEKGIPFVRVKPAYTSQTCNACGHVDKENRKTQSRFHCVECEHEDNADVNAAKNILTLGLTKGTGLTEGKPAGAEVGM